MVEQSRNKSKSKMAFNGDYARENERMPSFVDGQDWTEVKIRGKPKLSLSASQVNQKLSLAPNSYRPSTEGSHMNKLANSTDVGKLKKLTAESRQAIVNFRTSKTWNQQQLNQECRFPVNTIREIEAGRLTPSIPQLNTLNRVLKTGLKLE